MDDHPTASELEGFVWKRVPKDRVRDIIAHLVRGCESCREILAPHWAGMAGWSDPPEPVLSERDEIAYEDALDRVFATVTYQLGNGNRVEAVCLPSEVVIDELPEVPSHLQGIALFESLLERSSALKHDNPDEMVRLAQWARILAERFDPVELGQKVVTDLQCRAWIELGNAYRVADELLDAEQSLGRAAQLFVLGTEDELLAVRLFDVQASLFGSVRRFDLAETALDLVFAIRRRRGERHLSGRALVKKGIYVGYQGRAEDAVHLIEKSLELLDKQRDSQLVQIAFHNLGRFLMDCGRLKDARVALWKAKAYGLETGGRIYELKVRWLEAQVNMGLGELERAEAGLLEVRKGFEESNLPYKAALAGLELALVMLRRGRSDSAAREALAAVQVFYSLGIVREGNASVLLLLKAIQEDMLEIRILEYTIEKLRKAEDAPAETFEPPAEE